MRMKLVCMLAVVVVLAATAAAFSQSSGIDVTAKVQELLPLTCLTKAQVDPILEALIPGSSSYLAVAGQCLTHAEFAAYGLNALGMSRGIFEALFVSKTAYAQRQCILVVGPAAEALSGMELAVSLIGLIQQAISIAPLPAGIDREDIPMLAALMSAIHALTPSSVDATLLPCLNPVPTS